jgi:hypothetical protein
VSAADGWLLTAAIPQAPRLKWLLRIDAYLQNDYGNTAYLLETFAVMKPWPEEKAVFALPVTEDSWPEEPDFVEKMKIVGWSDLYEGGIGLRLARGNDIRTVAIKGNSRGQFFWSEQPAAPGLYRYRQR